MQESLGDYRILEPIGGGGSAQVFRARDTRSGRTVAIKVLTSPLTSDPAQRRQFLDDAHAAMALSHPNIATLYELGEHEGHPYLVFEFVPGQTLSGLIAGRPLNARRAIEFAIQAADALADAHASNLLHRGITPDTIVVTARGIAKIIDFGLGAYGTAVAASALSAGVTSAATAYWSPEQVAGAAVDHRVDIYALGLVLSEMLTGRHPSEAARMAAGLTGDIAGIVRKMTADHPDRRFDSAATLAAELRQVAATIDGRTPSTVSPGPPSTTARQNRMAGWMLAVLALAVLAVLTALAALTR
jgi:serine/threonine protein kinase